MGTINLPKIGHGDEDWDERKDDDIEDDEGGDEDDEGFNEDDDEFGHFLEIGLPWRACQKMVWCLVERRLLTSDSSISVDSRTSYSLITMMIDDHPDNEESQYLTAIVLFQWSISAL